MNIFLNAPDRRIISSAKHIQISKKNSIKSDALELLPRTFYESTFDAFLSTHYGAIMNEILKCDSLFIEQDGNTTSDLSLYFRLIF